MKPSEWLLLGLIFALPLMNPPVWGQLVVADALFLLVVAALMVELLMRRRSLPSVRDYWPLFAFVAALAPSLLATSDIGKSLFKLATEFYLVGLTIVTAWVVDSEAMFRRAVSAWLASTAVVALVAVCSLLAFATGQAQWLLAYSSYDFGSLPPGDYPRLALTFVYANMACNYLTVSLGLLFVAGTMSYIERGPWRLLLAGILVAAISTISPGLGGIALLAGLWLFVRHRNDRPIVGRSAIVLGGVAAALFLVALTVTPVGYPTAPFRMALPGGIVLYPAVRFEVWSAAFEQFVRHPLIGIGIGMDAVDVRYLTPSGSLEQLTDAHNIFLSIAAQCGVVGLIGLGVVVWLAAKLTPWPRGFDREQLRLFLLGATFLDVFVYQGLGGSFEDTRHVWVLLGLLIAASRPALTRPDGNSRTPVEPSPG